MNTVTICRLACSDSVVYKTFGGVYASDSLPRKKSCYSSFIANLDPHMLPGSHWVAIYFYNSKKVYYFDSYGLPPSNKNILRFLKKNARVIFYNKICFQEKFTTTCGHFCLYFLFKCARHLKLRDLCLNNKKINEIFIKKFTRQKFKQRKCCPFIYAKKQRCNSWIKMQASIKRSSVKAVISS